MKRELPIPPDADSAEEAIEILRGWLLDGCLQCSLFPTIWKDDPGTWGVLLADVANHIADAVAEDTGRPRDEVYERLCEVLVGELKSPSAKHEGTFVEHRENQ